MQSGFITNITTQIPKELESIKNPPKQLFYTGNIKLLYANPKIAIIGTRKPNQYTQIQTALLAKQIQKAGGIIVSGGALGTDIIAHKHSIPNTILISPSSLDTIYPASNAKIIKQIAKEGLIISEYENNIYPKRYEFLYRNRLIIGLSEIIIIPQADNNSGSMKSAQFCIEAKKPLFVLPHRMHESEGTQNLVKKNQAQLIYDIPSFLKTINLSYNKHNQNDAILDFCKTNPSFEQAYIKFGQTLLEYELQGKIIRQNGKICLGN